MSFGSDSLTLSIGQWAFKDIQAQNLKFDVLLTTQGLGLTAKADSINLALPIGRINNVNLQCDELVLLTQQFSCNSGQMAFQHQELGQQNLAFTIMGQPDDEKYQLAIKDLSLASASFTVNVSIEKNNWTLTADTSSALLTPLARFLSPYLSDKHVQLLTSWSIDGEVKLAVAMDGQRADTLKNLNLKLTATGINLSDTTGQYVTENVASALLLNLVNDNQDWQWQTELSIDKGQGYGEPVFIDFSTAPMTLLAEGQWQQNTGKIVVSNATIKHNNIAQLEGHFSGSVDHIEQLSLDLKQADIAQLYQTWLQPFIMGTALDNIELAGEVDLKFHQQADNYHLTLGLNQVFIDDADGRFGVDDLSGNVGWANYTHPVQTELQWKGGYVYAIPLGASHIKAQITSSSLDLIDLWRLPVLDGELQVNTFSLKRPGEEGTTWSFDGLLTPISMESLSTALKWPLLHGKLSGVIPNVSYVDQHIQVDGALMVKLFDGTTVIRNLRLDKPFGALPQLYANVDLLGLDLETLTQTFDFGKITGKLNGKMTNLRLSNWQPVEFDASFSTPEGDKSRRRISQKAVDNLSQIGGGAGGVLSRSFLRFFEDFSYQRLGLKCKLTNEVCEMSGVGEAEQGYYIVKGGGLPPRINVVGYTRRVNWPDLIERLKAVSKSSGPVVK
ncbi:MAG: hypothetical protein OEW63_00710 [Gammaproteobacteria bacterium]|nr:hypothetical protein [Gammaproteobacteria bacterium]